MQSNIHPHIHAASPPSKWWQSAAHLDYLVAVKQCQWVPEHVVVSEKAPCDARQLLRSMSPLRCCPVLCALVVAVALPAALAVPKKYESSG